MNFFKKTIYFFIFLATYCSFGQTEVRVIDNKGTVKQVDNSKWSLSGTDISNKNSGNVGIGGAPDISAKLEVNSTTGGFLPPRMTTLERDLIALPATGLVIFNTTTNALEINKGTSSAPVWNSSSFVTGISPISVDNGTTSPEISLINSGVTAGTYTSVTVNAQGLVTNATNPATTVSNTSTENDLTTTVNGVTGTAVPIINSVSNVSSGNTISTIVNGVTGTELTVPNIYTNDGTLAADRNVTQGGKNLTFISTSGNFIFNPSLTGKMGVGTTNPKSILHVFSSINESLPNSAATNLSTTPLAKFQNGNYSLGLFSRNSSPYTFGFQGFDNTTGNSIPLSFNVGGGNVGIGTANPAAKLEITHGTTGNSGLRFTNLNSASTATTASRKVLALNSTGDVILTNVPGTQTIISFSTADPNTGTPIFTPNTPADQSVLYLSSTNNSLWTYNGTTYVSYTAPSTTPFFLSGTTNDAGGNKTTAINRTGSVTVDNGFIRAANSGTTNAFTMDPLDAAGPKLKLGTTANPTVYFEIGAYNGRNNFDTKDRDLQIFGTGLGNTVGMMLKANTGYLGVGTTGPLGRLVVNDNAYITAMPASSTDLMTFKPLTRFQTTSGINNNAISHYMTTALAGTQVHNYSTGVSMPYILQPGGGNIGINTGNAAPISTFANTSSSIQGTNSANAINGGLTWSGAGSGFIGSFYSSNALGNGMQVKIAGTASTNNVFEVSTGTQAGTATPLFNVFGNGNVGIGTVTPANKLEITQGTAGNSGLRFTNLNSASTAATTSSKVLGLNSTGDVILTNVPGTQNIVTFSTLLPTTSGVVFTPNTPTDQNVIFQSDVDSSLWTYNGSTYVTYVPPSSTAWFTATTTNDAGSSKTSNIYRTGNVGIGATPVAKLDVSATTTNVARFSTSLTGTSYAGIGLGNGSGIWTKLASGEGKFQIRNFNTDAVIINAELGTGNVGIGNTNPLNRLVVTGTNNSVTALGVVQTNATFRIDGETSHSLDMGTLSASPYGAYIQSHNKGTANTLPLSLNPVGGNVGIGTVNPTSTLEVNGSATNTTAFNAGAASAISFATSNLAYTTASPGAFTLSNIKNGGTYTLAVQGTTSGTASFSASGFTFLSANNGLTISGKETLYTFVVMGAKVYFYMSAGF